mgnify:CR=1 FL=1
MDTLATLLNKALENINNLNDEMSQLKASHITLINKYKASCNTITCLEKKVSVLQDAINPDLAIDKVKLENLLQQSVRRPQKR